MLYTLSVFAPGLDEPETVPAETAPMGTVPADTAPAGALPLRTRADAVPAKHARSEETKADPAEDTTQTIG